MELVLWLYGVYGYLLVFAICCKGLGAFVRWVRLPKKRNVEEESSTGRTPNAVMTLVHGTWSKTADWTLPGSTLRATIQRELSSQVVTFRRFEWSGNNSISARSKAERMLTLFLQDGFQKYPASRHFIVAHSHGGNIAFQSLNNPLTRERLHGLICLSTPFLLVRRRPMDAVTSKAVWWVPAVMVLITLQYLAIALHAPDNIFVIVAMLIAAALVAFWASQWMNQLVERILELHQFPAPCTEQVLIIRTPGDEASALLSTAYFIAWCSQQILALPTVVLADTIAVARNLHARAQDWKKTGLTILTISAITLTWLLFGDATVYIAEAVYFPAVLVVFVVVFVVLLVLVGPGWEAYLALLGFRLVTAILVAPLIFPLTLLGLAVGAEGAAAATLLEVTPEATPPGEWQVIQMGHQETLQEHFRSALQHSESYHRSDALEEVTRWLRRRLS